MERDMEEILKSQETMLQRLGKSPAASEKAVNISKAYRQQERHAKNSCNLGIQAMSVSYGTLVHRPEEILPQFADFLGVPEKIEAMRACIDPAPYAQKSATLIRFRYFRASSGEPLTLC